LFFPPQEAPKAPTVPNECLAGFEMNNLIDKSFTLHALNPAQGSRAITLELDVATYRKEDTIKIVGVKTDGSTYTMFHTCRLRTWDLVDWTGGKRRPDRDERPTRVNDRPGTLTEKTSIREFRPVLQAGTKAIRFNFKGADSPTYIRVLGLCDFRVDAEKDNPFSATSPKFRPVNGR
jgi:hypothetical protein